MKVDIKHMPKSLEHDGLKDAVVGIAYKSDYNIRYISNKILDRVNKEYADHFIEIPTKDKDVANESLSYKETDSKIMLANSTYRILIADKYITFNFTQNYPGWSKYSKLIEDTLKSIDHIICQGIYLQYMSCFENQDIFTNLDGTIKLNQLPVFNGSEFSFSCACNKDEAKATVKLTNNKPIKNSKYSIVQITIVGKSGEYTVKDGMQELSICHKFEKHLFFLLLSDDFINSLKPKYE